MRGNQLPHHTHTAPFGHLWYLDVAFVHGKRTICQGGGARFWPSELVGGSLFFWRHARGLVAALKASNHLSATQQYCPARFGQSDRDWWFLLAAGLPCFAPLDRLASSSLGTCHRRTLRLHWRARQLSERCKTLGANARWRALDRAKAQPGLTKFQLPGQLMQHPSEPLGSFFSVGDKRP